ncbi:MAG: potassium transporter TrkG [Candidatus Omnitrophota bacterium]
MQPFHPSLKYSEISSHWLYRLSTALGCVLAAAALILNYGFVIPENAEYALGWIELGLAILFAALSAIDLLHLGSWRKWNGSAIIELVLLSALALELLFSWAVLFEWSWRNMPSIPTINQRIFSLEIYLAFFAARRAARSVRRLHIFFFSPAVTMALSFMLLIFTGACVLLLPRASHGTLTPNVSPIDALFTSTSAVCVTGLIVKDTPVDYSRFGQIVIAALIQLGGLGIMTFAAIFAFAFGQGGIRHRAVMQDILSTDGLFRVKSLLWTILFATLTCEGIGAFFLFLAFLSHSISAPEALFSAVFHSISAFCNAGFSTFSNNLETYAASPVINLTIIFLIVAGGIGFSVIQEMVVWGKKFFVRRSFSRLSLHSRLTLIVTGILLTAGFIAVLLGGDWREAGWTKTILASLFQSVTTRTAGFNTIPMNQLAHWCLVFFMMLMFVGGAPGGTAGGIKVTTLGLLFHTTRALMKGRQRVEIMRRTISLQTVRSAFVISGMAAAYVSFAVMALTWTDPDLPFFDIVFEVFSAFGTVGLSLGITAKLSTLGKIVIIITMYLGRVGPLTVFLAVSFKQDDAQYEYPMESIVVG